MFSTVFSAGKDLANKLSNKFLNLSDVEAKVKDATNEDPWGPHGAIMKEISNETFSTMNFNDIMTFLWYRIFIEKPINNRRTYKGLVLLSYLIINGSEYVAISCREHIHDLRKLESYYDINHQPDINIRKKAQDIINILSDPVRLADERFRAKNNQARFYSGNVEPNPAISNISTTSCKLGNFDDWQPERKSIPMQLGESFASFVNVFTQNISGPPPTVTHDNFEIRPSDIEYNTDRSLQIHEQRTRSSTYPVVSQTKPVLTSINNIQSKPITNQIVNQSECNKSIQETPIIDFSDSKQPNDTKSKSMNDFDNFNNVVNDKGDFGDFTSWNNQSIPASTNCNPNNINFNQPNHSMKNASSLDQCSFDLFNNQPIQHPHTINNQLINQSILPTSTPVGTNIPMQHPHPINNQLINQTILPRSTTVGTNLFPPSTEIPTRGGYTQFMSNTSMAPILSPTKQSFNRPIQPINSSSNKQSGSEFTADFSQLSNSNQSQSRISETWKDIGCLKIDLDNLCGSTNNKLKS